MRVSHFFLFSFFVNFALTVYLFFQQGISSGVAIPHFDKVGHFIAFFVLAACLDLGSKLKVILAVVFLASYGIVVEFIQDSIPGREASFADVIADVAGVLFYYFIFKKTALIQKIKSYA